MNLYLAVLRETGSSELENHISIVRRVLFGTTALAVAVAITEVVNYFFQIRALSEGGASARTSLDLLLGLYGVLFGIRLGMLGLGVVGLVGTHLWQRKAAQPLVRLLGPIYFAFLLVLVSEVLGRFLFYAIHVRMGY